MPNAPKGIPKPWLPKKETNKHNDRKRNESDRFYSTSQWKKLRDYFIKRNPLCKWCNEEGKQRLPMLWIIYYPLNKGDQKLMNPICNHYAITIITKNRDGIRNEKNNGTLNQS